MSNEKEFKEAIDLIKKANNIYVVAHVNPDGDAIGSSFAMYHVAKNMGKTVHVVMPKYSEKFDFLGDMDANVSSIEEDEYDLLICTDASDLERLAISPEDYYKAAKIIVIDHHVKKSIESDVKVLDENSPATCEIIYDMLKSQNIPIDQNIAKYIYLGLLTDTGSFNYQRTTSKTYRAAAELLDTGIDFADICKRINDTMKERKLKLVALAVDKMETYCEGRIHYTQVEWYEIDELEVTEEEASEGITNYFRMIEGTEVAIYVRGLPDGTYKASMRSNGKVDISKIAMHFNGGGHVRAAGFTAENMKNIKEELIEIIGDEL